MPEADAIRTTIDRYLATFSAGEREAWLDLWADGATMEDPVGTPVRTGREEIGAFYDQSQGATESVELRLDGVAIVVGHEAAFRFAVRPSIGGATMVAPAIDVMTFDDDARITSQRAFIDFGLLAPAAD